MRHMGRSRAVMGVALLSLALIGIGVAGIFSQAQQNTSPPASAQWLGEPRIQTVVDPDGNLLATISSSIESIGETIARLPSTEYGTALLAAISANGINIDKALSQRNLAAIPQPDGSVVALLSVDVADGEALWEALSWDSSGNLLTNLPMRQHLPANPSPDENWMSEGFINAEQPYLSQGRVIGEQGTCVLVESSTTSAAVTSTTEATWCPGEGQVRSRNVESDSTILFGAPTSQPTVAPVPDVPMLKVATTYPAPFPQLSVRDWTTLGGLIVVADRTSGDLLAWVPGDDSPIRWWHHPGGLITALNSTGNLVLIATSVRTLVAVDAAGQLRWSAELTDVARHIDPITEDAVHVELVSGERLILDPSSGKVRDRERAYAMDRVKTGPQLLGSHLISVDAAGGVTRVK